MCVSFQHLETAKCEKGNREKVPAFSIWTNQVQRDLTYHTGVELHACISTHAGRAHYHKQECYDTEATFIRNLKINLGVKVVCGFMMGVWRNLEHLLSACINSSCTVTVNSYHIPSHTWFSDWYLFLLLSLGFTLFLFHSGVVHHSELQKCINLSSSFWIKGSKLDA